MKNIGTSFKVLPVLISYTLYGNQGWRRKKLTTLNTVWLVFKCLLIVFYE